MNRRRWLWLGISMVIVVAGVPPPAAAGPSSDNLLELASKGGPSASLGFGVSPLHWEIVAPLDTIAGSTLPDSRVPGERERGRAVSFDLKLTWPTEEHAIEPYLVLGPALFVDQPQDLSTLLAPSLDPVVRLGAKAGAGFNWRLSKDATFFGSYDVTTTTGDGLTSPRTRTAPSGASTGYDLLYGVRFRY